MQLSPHFTLQEAIISETAARAGVNNTPDASLLFEIQKTAIWMEQIREALGNKVIIVTSWYRCLELEAAITKQSLEKVKFSQGHHPKGAAVDFICPSFGVPYEVAFSLSKQVQTLEIGQLCYEYNWIHISRLRIPNPINRVITGNEKGWQVGIVPQKI